MRLKNTVTLTALSVCVVATAVVFMVERSDRIPVTLLVATGETGALSVLRLDEGRDREHGTCGLRSGMMLEYVSRERGEWWLAGDKLTGDPRRLLYVVAEGSATGLRGFSLDECGGDPATIRRNRQRACFRARAGFVVLDTVEGGAEHVAVSGMVRGPFWCGDRCVVETVEGVLEYDLRGAPAHVLASRPGSRIDGLTIRGPVIVLATGDRVRAGENQHVSQAELWGAFGSAPTDRWYEEVVEGVFLVSMEAPSRCEIFDTRSGRRRSVSGCVSFATTAIEGAAEMELLKAIDLEQVTLNAVRPLSRQPPRP